ncbi:MAG: hypothetical protein ACREIV_13230, partial [Planctomycetaceae bacterium]
MRAPFPYFGGKSRAAALVWSRFGCVKNYVEPFAGSLAVLLARPCKHLSLPPPIETVNDAEGFIANFWRALQADPRGVAEWASWPVNEADLHARHLWLDAEGRRRLEPVFTDPDFFDAQVAGWWVWGVCQWFGRGWCSYGATWRKMPRLGDRGNGVHIPGPRADTCDGRLADIIERFGLLADRLRGVRVCCGDWTRVLSETP